jgi:hypothetical protein
MPTPVTPVPINARVEGSGTEVGLELGLGLCQGLSLEHAA